MRNHPVLRVLTGLLLGGAVLIGCSSVGGSASPDPVDLTTAAAPETAVTSLPPDRVVTPHDPDAAVAPVDTMVNPEAYRLADLDGYAWKSPTGNISCEFLQAPTVALTCSITEHQLTPAAGCSAGQPATATISAGVVQQGCRSDVPLDGPVLEYGDTIDLDNFACTSAEDGMSCQAGTQSFRISRATLDLQE